MIDTRVQRDTYASVSSGYVKTRHKLTALKRSKCCSIYDVSRSLCKKMFSRSHFLTVSANFTTSPLWHALLVLSCYPLPITFVHWPRYWQALQPLTRRPSPQALSKAHNVPPQMQSPFCRYHSRSRQPIFCGSHLHNLTMKATLVGY